MYNIKNTRGGIGMTIASYFKKVSGFKKGSDTSANEEQERIEAVRKNWQKLRYASEEIKNNRDIILEAVQQNGRALQYASEKLQNDRELVRAAVQNDVWALSCASKKLRNDHDFILEMVQQNANALLYASEKMKNKRDIVLAAIQKSWRSLEFASENMTNNPDIVMAAIQKSGWALEFASVNMKNNPDIVLAAVQKDGRALYHASVERKNDYAIVMAAVRQKGWALSDASEELKNNFVIVLEAVKQDAWALQFASEELRNNRHIVLAAVRHNGLALQFASEELRNDPDIVLAAMRQNGKAVKNASEELRNDCYFGLKAVRQDTCTLMHLSEEPRKDREIILTAVRHNGMALQYASDELRNDPAIVLTAVRKNWRAYEFASEDLKNDQNLSLIAQQEREGQSSRKTQALNFLWLNLDLPAKPDPVDGSIRLPLPEEYIQNVRDAGKRHPQADIHLWVDSRRLTARQWTYLEAVVEDEMPNVHVKDLCSIPQYRDEELYSRAETKKDWRVGYSGVVWLQVDAAKILISLQGDYDQRFFADLDHAHLDIESDSVQKMLSEQGMLIGATSAEENSSIENQLWGFDRSREQFFKDYYAEGLKMSYQGHLAYGALYPRVNREINEFEHITTDKICFPIGSIGLDHAQQPDEEWSPDYKSRTRIPDSELAVVFRERSKRANAVNENAPAASTQPKRAQASRPAAACA
jgi:lambda repressor-like predicted transcriptional regulator